MTTLSVTTIGVMTVVTALSRTILGINTPSIMALSIKALSV